MTNSTHGISTLIGSFSFFIIIGAAYNWGIVSDYYSSYLLKKTGNLNSFNLTKLGVSLLLFFEFLIMSLNSMINFTSLKNFILIGVLLNAISYFILIFGNSIPLFLIAMALIGIANGTVYLKMLNNTWMFFPKFKGQVSGLILGSLGLSAFLLNPLSNYIINPTKVGYDYKVYYLFHIPERTQYYIIFLFFFFSILGFAAYHFTYEFKDEEIEQFSRPNEISTKIDTFQENDNYLNINSMSEGLLTPQFIKIATVTFSLAFFSVFLSITFPSYARIKDVDEFLVQLSCLFFPFINGFGRVIWGFLVDIFSYKTLLQYIIVFQIVSIIFLLIFTNELMIFIFILFGALCLSGMMGIMPVTYNKIFGKKYGVEIFGVGLSTVGISSLITSLLINLKIDLSIIYLIGAAISIAGFFVLRSLDEEETKNNLSRIKENNLEIIETEDLKQKLL